MRTLSSLSSVVLLFLLSSALPTSPAWSQDQGAREVETESILPADLNAAELAQILFQGAHQPELATLIEQLEEQVLAEGDQEPEWQHQGIDLVAELSTLPGGLESNLLFEEDEDIRTVLDLSGSIHALPESFLSYEIRPDPAGFVAERAFIELMPGFWMETGHQRSQVGNALCYGGYIGVNLHAERPPNEWSNEELGMLLFLFTMVDRLAHIENCIVYDRDQSGRYSSRFFTPQGASLPGLNEQAGVSTILPVGELPSLFASRQ